jgi:arabinose-5-phosphate isomerase
VNQDHLQAAELMKLQADAIVQAADRLDPAAFRKAVDLVAGCRGKVIISGAGTSGIIGRKISATLTSTGTPALSLHPSDALHGGLGIVAADDVAILVTNSGETDEVLVLLPYLEERKVPVIAIVGNTRSTLARRADVVLDAFAEKEAGPLNLAPTTSTSIALAVGDSLAMAVMHANGVTPERFAQNHPSGRLGKRLTLRVSDVMHGGAERPVVQLDASWFDVVAAITRGSLGAVTVEDGDGRLLGIVTDGDLRRTVQNVQPEQLASLRAGDCMTERPVTVPADLLAYDALRLMEDRPSQISVLPAVDELDRCVGLVRLHDLVQSGI